MINYSVLNDYMKLSARWVNLYKCINLNITLYDIILYYIILYILYNLVKYFIFIACNI